MNNLSVTLLFALLFQFTIAQNKQSYQSLDSSEPITWNGNVIIYNHQTIQLGPKAFFIDGQLSDEIVKEYPYVFNSVKEAANHLTDGTENEPMVLYIAPYVYWIDDPDDLEIREAPFGGAPYGLTIDCEWLRFYGLNKDAKNVVLACNRGQTIGSKGNFTMFKFIGDGTSSENITFGNYCNVDLKYPLKPELNREKRASAIVQAQLIHCNGDKIIARNTRFISRLNLCPFVGGKRVLFDCCHFESTDDALCGTGIYLNSTLKFYSPKPFYHTTGTGAVFFNCDIHSFSGSKQYFTKANGQVTVIDTRITSDYNPYIGWRDLPPLEMKNYQFRVSHNAKPIIISKKNPYSTVDLSGKPLKNAYIVPTGDSSIYNTYNLLHGDDDWDPMNIKELVLKAEKDQNKTYTNIPVQLKISPTRKKLETGKDSILLKAEIFRFGNYPSPVNKIVWKVDVNSKDYISLKINRDTKTCYVIPTNESDSTHEVTILASTPEGLEAASVFTILPKKLQSPEFTKLPTITKSKDGFLFVNYETDSRYGDQSQITWYRCSDKNGNDAVEIAVTRYNEPFKSYKLTHSDIGYFIKASVSPKNLRSDTGKPELSTYKKAIIAKDIQLPLNHLHTDFKNLSLKNQEKIIPGFWTWKHFDGEDQSFIRATDRRKDAWYFGDGRNGAYGETGLLQQGRSATMFYTPVTNVKNNMKLTLKVSPFKSAGQGFSVAHLYMDILIKFDVKTLSGYGLRFIRTTKHGNAVDCYFIEYTGGKVTPISDPITTNSFRTQCTIELNSINSQFNAKIATNHPVHSKQTNVLGNFESSTTIKPNDFKGFGIIYYGGEKTIINSVDAEWY